MPSKSKKKSQSLSASRKVVERSWEYKQNRDRKLIQRFYEPLILLHTLSKCQDAHTPMRDDDRGDETASCMRDKRRTLLKHLCIVCDYDKGGDTVTAMAMEERYQGPMVWVAANENPRRRIYPFLGSILTDMLSDRNDMQQYLAREITAFCAPRIKKYWSLLQKSLPDCLVEIKNRGKSRDLQNWLRQFQFRLDESNGATYVCNVAYDARKSRCFRELERHANSSVSLISSGNYEKRPTYLVHHYIARLGCFIRAARFLAEISISHKELFEGFELKACSASTPRPPPIIDNQLCLDAITKRMFQADEETNRIECLDNLKQMDSKLQIMEEVENRYRDRNFTLRDHAELILLEQMYSADVRFYDGDKFIACSKPACFCCYHYFNQHPGGFVVPACHNNIWLNWSWPNLAEPQDSNAQKRQRDVLIKVSSKIRERAKEQIQNRSPRRGWHADSTNGTSSIPRSARQAPRPLITSALRNLTSEKDSIRGSLHENRQSNDGEFVTQGLSRSSSVASRGNGSSILSERETSSRTGDEEVLDTIPSSPQFDGDFTGGASPAEHLNFPEPPDRSNLEYMSSSESEGGVALSWT